MLACKKINQDNFENTREFKHQNKERLCYCCDALQESKDKINIYKIEGRGFGSTFNGDKIEIHLCDKCKKKIQEEWFNEKPVVKNRFERYQYEEKIKEFVDGFIIENQEYIHNCSNALIDNKCKESREDWLNYIKKDIIGWGENEAMVDEDSYISKLADEKNNEYFNAYNQAFMLSY